MKRCCRTVFLLLDWQVQTTPGVWFASPVSRLHKVAPPPPVHTQQPTVPGFKQTPPPPQIPLLLTQQRLCPFHVNDNCGNIVSKRWWIVSDYLEAKCIWMLHSMRGAVYFRNINFEVPQSLHDNALSISVRSSAWSRVPLEEIIAAYLVEKFAASYGNRKFISVFTKAYHWATSWARWMHFAHSTTIFLRSVLILSFRPRLGLQSGLYLSRLPIKFLYAFAFCKACYMSLPSHCS
jgi:hypothetical protein